MSSQGTGVSIPVGGSSAPGQMLLGLIFIALLFFGLYLAEILVKTGMDASNRFVTLIDKTVVAGSRTLTIYQDPTKYSDAKPLGLSVNERTGIEFAYSFYLWIDPTTFSGGTEKLKHVFHRGYACQWPLMGPGVFLLGNTNTMRIFMNTYKNPALYADVKNVPVQKWFHVVLNCYKGGLDVFVNGNLATRVNFADSLPYQNFQNVILFSNLHTTIPTTTGVLQKQSMKVEFDGAFSGQLSNLVYARYALSVAEIQGLLKKGPSGKVEQRTYEKPPYLADDWWAHQ